MSSYIERLNRLIPKGWISGKGDATGCTDIPLDHRLSFSPAFDEKWTFEDERRIRLNGVDIEEVIKDGTHDPGLLCGISQGLREYQEYVSSGGGGTKEKFNAVVNSLQVTVIGRLGAIYDGLVDGVRFECNDADFWINDINVRKVLRLYTLRPTDKARRYLAGLQNKLGLILSGRRDSTRYDGISGRAKELFDEISLALQYIPADAPLGLPYQSGRA